MGALRRFLATESAGGVVLLAATAAALVLANTPVRGALDDLWGARLSLAVGGHGPSLDLRGWVDDGLMTVFVLVVGLEIRREVVGGELRDPRQAALPVVAALGGMAVPALLYAAVNVGTAGARGWGVPTATDIALAVGVLRLVRPGVPDSLQLFLLALAIVDDIGAVVLIAVFYSGGLDLGMLVLAVGAVAAAGGLRALGVRAGAPFLALGIGGWVALHASGVHATLIGVAFGFVVPDRPGRRPLEDRLHPWSTFAVLPLFALANAGLRVDGGVLRSAASSRVAVGVVLGLVVGKAVGVAGAVALARASGLARLPTGATAVQVVGVAMLAGIGFTVSLFVTDLAFVDDGPAAQARLGILVGSTVAAALGTLVLRRAGRATGRGIAGDAGHHGPMTTAAVPDPPEPEPAAEDPVDEAGEESFPASDPPGWWSGASDPPATHPGG
jgi:NhaA family Na+:H+ antiporter